MTLKLPNLLPAIWMAVIFVLSVIPASSASINMPFFAPDKVAHLIIYAILAILWLNVLEQNFAAYLKAVIFAVGISVLYGGMLEFVQGAFVPYRSFEIPDIVANIMGAFAGAFVFSAYLLYHKKRRL